MPGLGLQDLLDLLLAVCTGGAHMMCMDSQPVCCVFRLNPYAVDAYDGVNLNPLEVVFIKVKSFLLQADWPAPKMSQTYDRWSTFKVYLLCHCHQ